MASPWIKNRPPERHVLILDRHKRIEMSILHGNIMKTISRGFQAVRNSPLSQTNIVCGILRVVTGLVRRGFRSPLRRGVPLMMSRGGARRKVGYNQSCGSLQVDPDPDPLYYTAPSLTCRSASASSSASTSSPLMTAAAAAAVTSPEGPAASSRA